MRPTPENIMKALRMEEPPEARAARKNCIMEHTMMLALLITFLVILSAAGGAWMQTIPLAVLAAAITLLIVRSIYQAQTSAYYLGKYHGLVDAYAHRPEAEETVPEELKLAAEKSATHPGADLEEENRAGKNDEERTENGGAGEP